MCFKEGCLFLLLSVLVCVANARPFEDEVLLQDMHDTATVESIVREARAAPQHIGDLLKPGVKDAFLYTYGDAEGAAGDHHGYSKKTNGQGKDGYKHFDSYHKKDGDKYGFERRSEYGQENKDKVDTDDGRGAKKEKDDGEETQNSYRVFEEGHGDNKKNKKSMVDDYEGYNEGAGTNESESYQSESGGDGEGGDGNYEYAESESYSEGSEGGGEGGEGAEGGEESSESEGGSYY